MDVEHDSGSYQSNKDCLLLGWNQWAFPSSRGVLVLGLLGDDVVHVLERRGECEGGQDAPCRLPSLRASQRGLRGWETMFTATAILAFRLRSNFSSHTVVLHGIVGRRPVYAPPGHVISIQIQVYYIH